MGVVSYNLVCFQRNNLEGYKDNHAESDRELMCNSEKAKHHNFRLAGN